MLEEWVIGFEAREMWYFKKNENMELLRREIVKPLSADSSIWGSVFNDGQYPLLADDKRKELGFGTIPLPEWVGSNNPLWDNLDKLKKYLSKQELKIQKPYWIIAVTGLKKYQNLKRDPDDWPHISETKPQVLNPKWKCIGYDINTCYNECRLTGSSFEVSEEEMKAVVDKWGQYLNEYHLFVNKERAVEFGDYLDQTEKSGAPHVVFGIWLIKEDVHARRK